jgi:rare lipoprotein A
MPHRYFAALTLASILAMPIGAEARCVMTSWYGYESGSVTASGARFRPDGLSAAHRTMKFGTKLRVTYGGKSVIVTVNDRGPAKWTGRSLDLSRGAASALGIIRRGIACVGVTVVR